ncbi:MAG: hypothetical protein DMF64_09485 [Acidobacteria bacterium]|nr:MAG: hypothetical protein DMF64_09485 [Acidobacteriota bacterium]
MTEAEQTFLSEPNDPETTLITPRFDAAETQMAQPVVPLAARRARRRVWPLLLLSALLGGAVSLFGLYLYQRPSARTSTTQPTTNRPAAVVAPVNATPTPAPTATVQVATQASDAHEQAKEQERAAEPAPTDDAPTGVQPKPSEPAVVEARRAPAQPGAEKREIKEQVKPARAAGTEVRPRLVDVMRDGHDADAQHRDVPTPREARPRERQPQPTAPRTQPRNVDRIRDIFEGEPPPA